MDNTTIETRQDNLLNIVKKIGKPPYVSNVTYDHDESLIKDEFENLAKRLVEHPQFWDKYILRLNPDRAKQLSQEQFNRLLSNDNYNMLLVDAIENAMFSSFNHSDHGACTISHPLDFGKANNNSHIYVFDSGYSQMESIQKISDGVLTLEDSLIVTLDHEYRHARQANKGMDFGNGLSINRSNHHKIAKEVTSFLEEVDAYCTVVSDKIKLGRYHPQSLIAVLVFTPYLKSLGSMLQDFDNMELTNLERRLVDRGVKIIERHLRNIQ